jgi:hypothetical protein
MTLVVVLEQLLNQNRNISIYPAPVCEKNCVFNLQDALGEGAAAPANAWDFVFPKEGKRYTLYFGENKLKRVRYERQRFKGDGVF